MFSQAASVLKIFSPSKQQLNKGKSCPPLCFKFCNPGPPRYTCKPYNSLLTRFPTKLFFFHEQKMQTQISQARCKQRCVVEKENAESKGLTQPGSPPLFPFPSYFSSPLLPSPSTPSSRVPTAGEDIWSSRRKLCAFCYYCAISPCFCLNVIIS